MFELDFCFDLNNHFYPTFLSSDRKNGDVKFVRHNTRGPENSRFETERMKYLSLVRLKEFIFFS